MCLAEAMDTRVCSPNPMGLGAIQEVAFVDGGEDALQHVITTWGGFGRKGGLSGCTSSSWQFSSLNGVVFIKSAGDEEVSAGLLKVLNAG
jgi:hypothetical protein